MSMIGKTLGPCEITSQLGKAAWVRRIRRRSESSAERQQAIKVLPEELANA